MLQVLKRPDNSFGPRVLLERITGPLPEPKSSNDFLYKIEVVLEEADESHYWLEVVKGAQLHSGDALDKLIREANELTAIFAATDKTNKAKIKKSDIIDQK